MRGIWVLLIFIVCLFLGLAVGCVAAWRTFGHRGLLISLVGYAAAGLAADLLCGVLFYTYGTFTCAATKRNT
jgi:hypothetical protein